MYYNFDSKLKKRMLKEYIKQESGLKFRIISIFCTLLNVIGVVLFLGLTLFFGSSGVILGIFLGAGAGAIFGMIPILISIVIKGRTIQEMGYPYSRRSKGFLHLEKAGVEFGYHYDENNRFETSMNLYQICYEDIQNIEYDPKCMMLTITGVAHLTAYDDLQANRINYELSQRRFYSDSKYSFILATPDAEKIIEEIKKNMKEEEYDEY